MDLANGRGLAVLTGPFPLAFDVLAKVAAMGRKRNLAASLATLSGRIGRRRATAMGRELFGRQFCAR